MQELVIRTSRCSSPCNKDKALHKCVRFGSRNDAYFVLYYIRKVRKESVDINTVSTSNLLEPVDTLTAYDFATRTV